MRRALLEQWDRLRGSYWFVPGVMSVGAVVLAVAAVWSDVTWAADTFSDEIPWLVANRPDGARALLTTIAGSMITVAGVTFSITIAAVAYVSSQLGPRVLDAFMRDTGNQVTLGTFIGTFIYCLLVLRTVRSAEEGGVGFVPELAVLLGFVLALVSVAVLIFFVHHVPLSIHASHVVAAIGHDLEDKVEAIFPEPFDNDHGDEGSDAERRPPDVPEALGEPGVDVASEASGYLVHVDQEDLLEMARERDLVVEVLVRPGAFVRVGMPVLRLHPDRHADDADADRARESVKLGRRRTQTQDVLFLVNELAEIAGRALSPGVNDPFTAMTCIDWLGAGLSRMAARRRPLPYRTDAEGFVRVVAPPTDFPLLVEEAFSQIRPYVERDRNASLRMMEVLEALADLACRDVDREAVLARADALLRGGEEALPHEDDREALREAHRGVAAAARSAEGEPRRRPDRVDAPADSD